MDLYIQFSKRRGIFQFVRQVSLILGICGALYPGNLRAQGSIFDKVLETAGQMNDKLLKVTELTDDEENKIGVEVDKKIMKDHQKGTYTKYDVAKIFERVKKNIKRKNIKYRFRIVKDKEVNAFAIVGGMVYLNTGLLDYISSDDELAFVIGHEISHNEYKHCAHKIQYAARASKLSPVLGNVVQIAYNVATVPFSKEDEYQADSGGVAIMQKSGFDKQGALDFFDKLYKMEKKHGVEKRDGLNDFISSHPTAEKRKERIKKEF